MKKRYEDEITCPRCGYTISESWEFNFEDGEAIEIECPDCERMFSCEREISVTYTTGPIKKETRQELEGGFLLVRYYVDGEPDGMRYFHYETIVAGGKGMTERIEQRPPMTAPEMIVGACPATCACGRVAGEPCLNCGKPICRVCGDDFGGLDVGCYSLALEEWESGAGCEP